MSELLSRFPNLSYLVMAEKSRGGGRRAVMGDTIATRLQGFKSIKFHLATLCFSTTCEFHEAQLLASVKWVIVKSK